MTNGDPEKPVEQTAQARARCEQTAFFSAVRNGPLAKLTTLLNDNPALALARDDNGETPLMLAVRGGSVGISRLLLKASDAKAINPSGFTPLLLAVRNANLFCVQLLAPYSDVGHQTTDGVDALMIAAYKGLVEIVQCLLPLSNPHARNKEGETALMCAALGDDAECVALLLPHSDPRARSLAGKDALMQAAALGNLECIQLLLPLSDATHTDSQGYTAMELSAEKLVRAASLEPHRWTCMDLLATQSPVAVVQKIWDWARPQDKVRLPRCWARIEQEVLRAAMQGSPSLSSIEYPLRGQALAQTASGAPANSIKTGRLSVPTLDPSPPAASTARTRRI